MHDAALEVRSLVAGYVPGLPILHSVNLRAERGKVTAIIGPNGAGKSTLIKAIGGLVPIASGSITHEGRDVTGQRPDLMARQGLAYVPQNDNIFRSLTVRQNLDLAASRATPGAGLNLDELFQRFPPLAAKARDRAGSLSGGQRQFLAVAMALAAAPRTILMDEPSAGLSPKAAAEVLAMARQLAVGGVAIVLVEQNVKQALAMADHCYLMAEGRNQIDRPAAALLQDKIVGEVFLGARRAEVEA